MSELPFPVVDETEGEQHLELHPTKLNTAPLHESFGRNLDTLEKARLWLTNPHNWHNGTLFILKWDGLLCTVMKEQGERLIRQPHDQGLPWCVVSGQRHRKTKAGKGEKVEEVMGPAGENEDG